MNKKEKDLQEAIWELLATEVTYLRKLRVFKKVARLLSFFHYDGRVIFIGITQQVNITFHTLQLVKEVAIHPC